MVRFKATCDRIRPFLFEIVTDYFEENFRKGSQRFDILLRGTDARIVEVESQWCVQRENIKDKADYWCCWLGQFLVAYFLRWISQSCGLKQLFNDLMHLLFVHLQLLRRFVLLHLLIDEFGEKQFQTIHYVMDLWQSRRVAIVVEGPSLTEQTNL